MLLYLTVIKQYQVLPVSTAYKPLAFQAGAEQNSIVLNVQRKKPSLEGHCAFNPGTNCCFTNV